MTRVQEGQTWSLNNHPSPCLSCQRENFWLPVLSQGLLVDQGSSLVTSFSLGHLLTGFLPHAVQGEGGGHRSFRGITDCIC